MLTCQASRLDIIIYIVVCSLSISLHFSPQVLRQADGMNKQTKCATKIYILPHWPKILWGVSPGINLMWRTEHGSACEDFGPALLLPYFSFKFQECERQRERGRYIARMLWQMEWGFLPYIEIEKERERERNALTICLSQCTDICSLFQDNI